MKKRYEMKKMLCALVALMLGLSFANAQMPMPEPLPMDPSIRYGKLENGLTYYIKHNALPEHRAEFYIAQRVGSMQEEESQRGLAHFLEHMAFNGLAHFPGKSMLNYLQDHGVKFGTNINAYTSFEETVYNISAVPTDSVAHPNIIDSCLLVLHDWSGFISLEGEEIDNERGVIHEEWRARSGAINRLLENSVLPTMMKGTLYPKRLPIGLMSVVDSFSHEELRSYYHKWYRPDLQAVIIVGDVNVDTVEQRIKTMWKDIQTPADAAERTYSNVPDNDEPLVCVASDKEFPYNEFCISYKRPKIPRELKLSAAGILLGMMESVVGNAINTRLSELALKADAPFQGAGVGFGDYMYSKTVSSFNINVSVKPGKWKAAMHAAMGVVKNVMVNGITQAELDRAMASMKSGYENAYNEREKRKNGSYVNEIKRHFLNDDPMPGIEVEWKQLFPMAEQFITLDQVNQFCRNLISEKNYGMYMLAKQSEDNVIPTEEEFLAGYRDAVAQEVVAYKEEALASSLIAKLPKPGKIKKVENGPFGSTVWTLSNGVRLVWKSTDFKKDEVSLFAYSDGGSLQYGNESIINARYMGLYDLGGVGDFSPMDLRKFMAGKNASVNFTIGSTSERISASATPKDMRTMFELLYLNFTAPRKDQEIFQSTFARLEQSLKNQFGTPQMTISDSLTLTFYKGIDFRRPITLEDLKDVNYDRIYEMGKERFSNAADFTFFMIGNINEDSLRAMSVQYLATLPASKAREKRSQGFVPTPGSRENRFDVEMEQPKTQVTNRWSLYNQPWNLKDDILASMLGQVLRQVFTETIREREGGVYSPSAGGSFDEMEGYISLRYNFTTGADKLAHIEEVAYNETCKLSQPGGVRIEDFQRARDYMLKRYEESQKENNYWKNVISDQYLFNINSHDNYKEILNSLTTADVEAMAARLLKGDRIQFVANGIEKKK